jgi:hypothetical protein
MPCSRISAYDSSLPSVRYGMSSKTGLSLFLAHPRLCHVNGGIAQLRVQNLRALAAAIDFDKPAPKAS